MVLPPRIDKWKISQLGLQLLYSGQQLTLNEARVELHLHKHGRVLFLVYLQRSPQQGHCPVVQVQMDRFRVSQSRV